MEDLQSSLERAEALKVAFSPITKNSIKKTLQRICTEEHCKVTTVEIDQMASASGGDIRNAITSLQLFSVKPELNHTEIKLPQPRVDNSYQGNDQTMQVVLDSGISSCFGRDETLSLFHALGKFLHNIRETDHVIISASRGKMGWHSKTEDVLQSAGASVAVHGVLYGNKQPWSSRWHTIHKPKLWQVEQSSLQSKKNLREQRNIGFEGSKVSDISLMANGVQPRAEMAKATGHLQMHLQKWMRRRVNF